ncbi:MAG: retron system putative HNH endonuclease [Bacteroidota bacterium]|nr:retron system putative HNH endonuclease [Bacteroidota bacterium]
MIKVEKKTKNIPKSLSDEKFKNHYVKFSNNDVKALKIYYSAKDVKSEFKKLYKNKCAYCESIENNPETEHYRPVSKYRYLAYEWSNLLPACHSCNLNKKDKFPIKTSINTNTNITNIQKLNEIEEPFVINPEIDNPEEYFEFCIKEGKILAKKDNERAKTTIELCKLNRTNLIERRKEKFDNTAQLVNYLTFYTLKNLKHREKLTEFIKNLKNKTKSKNEFSALQKQIWNNFEVSIVPLIKDKKLIDFVLTEYKRETK